jgi:hypothetical protein
MKHRIIKQVFETIGEGKIRTNEKKTLISKNGRFLKQKGKIPAPLKIDYFTCLIS